MSNRGTLFGLVAHVEPGACREWHRGSPSHNDTNLSDVTCNAWYHLVHHGCVQGQQQSLRAAPHTHVVTTHITITAGWQPPQRG